MEIITNEIIRTVVEALLIPIMTILSAYIVQLLKVKISTLSDTQFKNYLSASLDELNQAINTAVGKVAQTYVDSLKDKEVFTVEAQKEAYQKTMDAVMAILSDEEKTYLTNTFGDLETYLQTQIEATVSANKKTPTVTE